MYKTFKYFRSIEKWDLIVFSEFVLYAKQAESKNIKSKLLAWMQLHFGHWKQHQVLPSRNNRKHANKNIWVWLDQITSVLKLTSHA